MFKSRTLKISSHYFKTRWQKPNHKPKLTICGKWFENAGFEIGAQIQITVSQNQLIITKI
jgi:hypothetical protein